MMILKVNYDNHLKWTFYVDTRGTQFLFNHVYHNIISYHHKLIKMRAELTISKSLRGTLFKPRRIQLVLIRIYISSINHWKYSGFSLCSFRRFYNCCSTQGFNLGFKALNQAPTCDFRFHDYTWVSDQFLSFHICVTAIEIFVLLHLYQTITINSPKNHA